MKHPETIGPTAAIEPAAVVPRPHRIVEVDALRGFALCGIFLANVLVMSGLDGLGGGGGGGSAGPTASRLAARLAPAGRMALTNYLAQSVVMALVFTGYGAALYGRVGAAAVLGGTLLFYGFQLASSAWLMSRHRLGPVERLLRAVTLWGRPAPRG
ncbi:DUF418 domain-containing protein [Streptomyces cyaneofuscatus]